MEVDKIYWFGGVTMKNKKIIVVALVSVLVGCMIGVGYHEVQFNRLKTPMLSEMSQLSRGSYVNVIEQEGLKDGARVNQIVLNIQDEHSFNLYNDSKLINEGTYETIGKNEFAFKGKSFDFRLIANAYEYNDVRKKIGKDQTTYIMVSEDETIFLMYKDSFTVDFGQE